MATYHLRVKALSRGRGQNAVAAAAYRSGERLIDAVTGRIRDYADRAGRVRFAGIFLPFGAPAWARDRATLWNAVERIERRRDATLAREIELSLPHELTDRQRLQLVRDFVRENLVRRGLAVDVAIHAPETGKGRGGDPRNHHAHLLVVERQLGPRGFAARKDRGLQSKATLYGWRANWAALCNRYLAAAGHAVRVDHRSFRARGICDRQPTTSLGPVAAAMQRRGKVTPRGERLRQVQARNAVRQCWRDAAALTGPSPPRPKRQRGRAESGDQADSLATQAVVDRYLRLCHDPLRNLDGWLAEQRRPVGQGRTERPIRGGGDHERRSAFADELRRDALPTLRGGMDAPEGGWRDRDGMPARPGGGAGWSDRLRPLRTETDAGVRALASLAAVAPERAAPDAARELCSRGSPDWGREASPLPVSAFPADSGGEVEPCSYEAEAEGIVRQYARQIEGIRQTAMPRWMMDAAIRAVRDAQRAALAAMRERRYWRRQRPVERLGR